MKSIFSRLLKFSIVRVVAPDVNYILIHPKEDQNPLKFSWEPLLTQEIHNACHSDNEDVVFFDVGGAFGIFSKYVSLLNNKAQIVSFEPYWLRRYTMILNTIFCGRIKFSKKFIAGESQGQNITLQDAATEIGLIPTVIKMDIEGAEYDVIMSSLSFLEKTKPLILLEFHENIMKRAGLRPENIIQSLRAIGYSDENLEHHGVSSGNFLIKFTYEN